MGVNYARRECAASRGGGARFDELVAEPAQTQIEEVILTAQKREERLQDVPITMSVFGEKTERLSVEEFEDVTRQVPGLTHTENGRHPTPKYGAAGGDVRRLLRGGCRLHRSDQVRRADMFGMNPGGPLTPLSDPSAGLVGNARRQDVNSSTTLAGVQPCSGEPATT